MPWKRKGFCALISVDIRNAFNSARWKICIESMMRKKLPDYLLRMIDNYISSRWVIYEGDPWTLKEEMTCGAPQGSRVGSFVWRRMNITQTPFGIILILPNFISSNQNLL